MLSKLKRPVNEHYNSTGYGWKTQLFVTWPVNKCLAIYFIRSDHNVAHRNKPLDPIKQRDKPCKICLRNFDIFFIFFCLHKFYGCRIII